MNEGYITIFGFGGTRGYPHGFDKVFFYFDIISVCNLFVIRSNKFLMRAQWD